jgi:hypothetical protein
MSRHPHRVVRTARSRPRDPSTDAALHQLRDPEVHDARGYFDRALRLPTNIEERLIGGLSAASRP